MGQIMREYWMPIARADEIKADGDPLRLRVLGENLIAFRDTDGRVGVMDHRCPHRCASLFFGRNEEGGLRCVYHGWKFDVEGNCLDMANVPPHQDFKHKVKAKAYPARERNGAIWVYMGARKVPPPMPDFELNRLRDEEIVVRMVHQDCNWLQSLENDIDTSHFGFLHFGSMTADMFNDDDPYKYLAADRAPQFHIEDTPVGMMYGSYRPADEGTTYWRLAHYMVPVWIMPPAGPMSQLIAAKAYVPLDDTNTMVVGLFRKIEGMAGMQMAKNGKPIPGLGDPKTRGATYRPNTTDWLGRWRLVNNAGNDYLIDREKQRTGGVFSGIEGIQVQDTAASELPGPISDRTFEHLASSDETIARVRRMLIRLLQSYQKNKNTVLPGVDQPQAYRGHRGGFYTAPNHLNFRDSYESLIQQFSGEAPRWAAE
jgi:nitrite reductase/ring-hydroxylating ferredoxin subunit